MNQTSKLSIREKKREVVREVICETANRLIHESPTSDFSMRKLAKEAGVGFTTLFDHFGSKTEILRMVAKRNRADIIKKYFEMPRADKAIDRVLNMSKAAIRFFLNDPATMQKIIASLAVPVSDGNKHASREATEMWDIALEDSGNERALRPEIKLMLTDQLAIMFLGVITLWSVGELSDQDLEVAMETSIYLIFSALGEKQVSGKIDTRIRDNYSRGGIVRRRKG